jgi:hypothetical protein
MSIFAHLKGIASVCFSVDHLHDIFMHLLSSLVSITPIICRSNAILANEEVFRIVNVFIWAGLDTIDYLDAYALARYTL